MLPRTTGLGQSFPPSASFNCGVSTLPVVKGEPCSATCSEASWILPHYAAIASPSHDTAKRFPVGKKKTHCFMQLDMILSMVCPGVRGNHCRVCAIHTSVGYRQNQMRRRLHAASSSSPPSASQQPLLLGVCLSQAKHVSGIQHTPSLTSDHGYLGYCHALLTQNNCSPDSSHSPNMGKPEISRPGSPHCWMREKEGVSVVLGQAYCQSRDNS